MLPLLPLRPRRANGARRPCRARCSNLSLIALWTGIARSTLWPLWALCARLPLRPGYALHSLRALRTRRPLRASFSLRAGWPRFLTARREQDRQSDRRRDRHDLMHSNLHFRFAWLH